MKFAVEICYSMIYRFSISHGIIIINFYFIRNSVAPVYREMMIATIRIHMKIPKHNSGDFIHSYLYFSRIQSEHPINGILRQLKSILRAFISHFDIMVKNIPFELRV